MSRAASLSFAVFALLAAGLLPLPCRSGLIAPPMAQAQNIGDRTVTGNVYDGKSDPVSGAVVFLQNQKSKTIRSYTTDTGGSFSFAQVDMTQDFNLWAEKGSRKSGVKVVSSWDARKKWVGDLRLK